MSGHSFFDAGTRNITRCTRATDITRNLISSAVQISEELISRLEEIVDITKIDLVVLAKLRHSIVVELDVVENTYLFITLFATPDSDIFGLTCCILKTLSASSSIHHRFNQFYQQFQKPSRHKFQRSSLCSFLMYGVQSIKMRKLA